METFNEMKEEMISGILYRMLPARYNHFTVIINIGDIFNNYLKSKNMDCVVTQDNVDLYFDEDNWVHPDNMIICDRNGFSDNGYSGVPELVVEVLSGSTMERDRIYKFKKYQELGIKEYWLITPEIKTVEQYILKDGKYVINKVYYIDLKDKTGLSKNKSELKVTVFDDLVIDLNDIFKHVK